METLGIIFGVIILSAPIVGVTLLVSWLVRKVRSRRSENAGTPDGYTVRQSYIDDFIAEEPEEEDEPEASSAKYSEKEIAAVQKEVDRLTARLYYKFNVREKKEALRKDLSTEAGKTAWLKYQQSMEWRSLLWDIDDIEETLERKERELARMKEANNG